MFEATKIALRGIKQDEERRRRDYTAGGEPDEDAPEDDNEIQLDQDDIKDLVDVLSTLWNNIPDMGWFADATKHSSTQGATALQALIYSYTNKPDRYNEEVAPDASGELAFKQCQLGLLEWRRNKEQPSEFYGTKDSTENGAAKKLGPLFNKLYKYQVDGLGQLCASELKQRGTSSGTILADEMGLGKTAQTIALIIQHPSPKGQPTLIVAEPIVLQNWEVELRHWTEGSLKIAAMGPWLSEAVPVISTMKEFAEYDVVLVSYTKVAKVFSALKAFCDDALHRKRYPYPARKARQAGSLSSPEVKDLHLDFPEDLEILKQLWFRVILDESQRINRMSSMTSMGCCALRSLHRLSISGTPQQNDYTDVCSQLKFLGVQPFCNPEWFKCHFLNKRKPDALERAELMSSTGTSKAKVRPHEHESLEGTRNAILYLAVLPEMVRRKAKDLFMGEEILSLPTLTKTDINVELDDGRKYHKWMKEEASRPGVNHMVDMISVHKFNATVRTPPSGSGQSSFASLTKKDIQAMNVWFPRFLPSNEMETQYASAFQWCEPFRDSLHGHFRGSIPKQEGRNPLTIVQQGYRMAFHPALVLKTPHELRNLLADEPRFWRSAKSERAVQIIREHLHVINNTPAKAPEDRWVVAGPYIGMLDIMETGLKYYNISVARLDGQTPIHDRPDICDAFNKGGQNCASVLLLSTRVGGNGINLKGANRLINLAPGWNPEVDNQLDKRCHRFGQTKPVHVYHLRANFSMDTRILDKATLKKFKNYGIMDLFHIADELLSPDQLTLKKASLRVIKDMASWDKTMFIEKVSTSNLTYRVDNSNLQVAQSDKG